MYKLGIDIGGTNIDFAIVNQQNHLLYAHKQLAKGELHTAITSGLRDVVKRYALDLAKVRSIHLGTTLAINSLLALQSLHKVGLLRLAGHHPDFPPAYLWPAAHREAILSSHRTIAGGREYNNAAITPLNPKEVLAAANALLEEGAESLAIISVFSPLYAEDELEAASLIQDAFAIPVSLSHQLGNLGFVQRENATILNAALKKSLREGLHALRLTLDQMGFHGECFITQNNGTMVSLAEAIEFPVKTIASGPTNSLIGACKLAQCQDAIVVDIGGTSTDIGIVENGFPLYSLKGSLVAGIPCHLVAPDITALAMGGGSMIREKNGAYLIGPDSVGAQLFEKCRTNGGPCLTLYDLGQALKTTPDKRAESIMSQFLNRIQKEIASLVSDPQAKPVLLVGGGSDNIPENMLPLNYHRPPQYAIANAYGAALSEVAGHVDCILQDERALESQIEILEQKAISLAEQKGAVSGRVRIIEKKILPLHYMQKPMYRVLITAAGEMEAE